MVGRGSAEEKLLNRENGRVGKRLFEAQRKKSQNMIVQKSAIVKIISKSFGWRGIEGTQTIEARTL